MADIYVASGGSNTSPYDTWAKAATSFPSAVTLAAAGDRIFVDSAFSETLGAITTMTLAGTGAAPCQVISVNRSGDPEPPTVESGGAAVNTGSGPNSLNLNGCGYFSGMTFAAGVGGGSSLSFGLLGIGNNEGLFRNCTFHVATGSASTSIALGPNTSGAEGAVTWKNCGVRFGNAGQRILLMNVNFRWEGGSVLSGGSSPTNLIAFGSNGASFVVSGVDLSNLSAGSNLVDIGVAASGRAIFRNCKLPSGWSGDLLTGTVAHRGTRVEMYNCDSTDTNYRLWIKDYCGSVKSETAVYRDGGATDGTTPISFSMSASANADFELNSLESQEIVVWNESLSAMTATVEILHDGAAAFKNDDVWMDVAYLGTSGSPLGAVVTTAKASPLATGAAITSSAETWTGASGTGPNGSATWHALKLVSPSFTPAQKGWVTVRVHVGSPGKTVYVDPVVTLE